MLKQRIAAAQKIATDLHEAEEAVDQAIIKLAQLAGTLPVARFETNMSAIVGQEAVAKVTQAVAAAGQVRQMVTDAHEALSETQKQVGLGPRMFGAGMDKPRGQTVSGVQEAANGMDQELRNVA
jgi:nitrogenase molybdenum-iron protein alpha/beta subunit